MMKGEIKPPKNLFKVAWNEPTTMGFQEVERHFFKTKQKAIEYAKKDMLKDLREAEETTEVRITNVGTGKLVAGWFREIEGSKQKLQSLI